ncbi:DNA-binding protein [Neisseria meningitidis]|uniref:DNA-binding protein n=1 Tax=Neisseria meningitidis TaxID=487 RepID=UPI001F306F5A|nr:DNA-binding protein [Neisseria meningitidis]
MNFKTISYPQTRESAAGWFKRNGVCKAHWAKYFNLERTTVEHLLRGKLKGNFGKSHEAAVLLGMKEKSDD